MGDAQFIPALVQLASNATQLQAAQDVAAQRLFDYDSERFPTDACAITLSVLLQDAGINVQNTFMAIDLGNVLKQRGWQVIAVGGQKQGDVGSACGTQPQHGVDHIYLVLQAVDANNMVVADNQAPRPHARTVSGHDDISPTTFFLRASA